MDRRTFVAGLSASLGIRFVPLTPLGVQLYTVRREAERDLDGTLARLAQIGYREVEFWNYYGRTPEQIRGLLDRHGLASPSVHVGLERLEGAAAAATLDAAREIGHRTLIVAGMPAAARRSAADWVRAVERLAAAGETARRHGLTFAYHNHDWEFQPLGGVVPWDLLTDAPGGAIGLQLDVFWAVQAGRDPLALLRRFAGRIHSLHVKDRTADGRMVDVGAGVLDWRALLGEARRTGVRHFYVEHDEPADAFASVEASYRYLNQLEL